MSRNLKISAALVAVFVLAVTVLLGLNDDRSAAPGATADAALVRDDSHRLSTAEDGRVTLVEFLDFECESCRAAYPFVEQLRERYEGEVTFVARYFPMPGHANAENAAVAVEAAAQQGEFEAMYHRMYETQPEWGERQDSQAALFRTFAADLGLDMAAYAAAVADPATLERVLRDREDGLALRVEGTPTFFLNGEKLEVSSTDEFIERIDAALAG
ncbi:disulfide bond formation protein DsbA [Blastococcus sp. MG754426]|uniref:DsbA family protein n=1 Tax=unclassified Blastococcus TaxID=2619396 RepID=UPI001EEFC9A3|nr:MULTISPECIES: thioredoxin domain-containing protein [unclassified Blastococcus]MCF6507779.1 disulfide bond formation protein DsbA [Blastococcus sp. MG754426]MCF6510214.1 disulfide bond formation protein DsbA [Blastococcus sp. MG754427]MCF6735880.1 disulfide bond formation protein DsbA [Blastococcus sp. KM273129]